MINSKDMDVMKAPGYAGKMSVKAEEAEKDNSESEMQLLDNLPVTEEVMDDDIKAGLMSMFD